MSVSVCLKVLLMWSWGREKAAPGLLGSEPCGGDPGSTWCWVGQWQVPGGGGAEGLGCAAWEVMQRQHSGRAAFRNLVFHSSSRAGRMCWCGVWHVWFSSGVSPSWHDCIWVQAGGWAGMLWAAVPAEEQNLNTGCPSPLVQETGHEQVLQRCRQIRFPVAHQLPCRLTCPVELSAWSQAGSGQQGRVYSSDGQTWWAANLDSIWILVASVLLGSHFLTNRLNFVLYCVWKHPRAVLIWRYPPPWEGTMWWQELNQEKWHYTGAEVAAWSCNSSAKQLSLRASQFYSTYFLVWAVMNAFSWPWESLPSFLK